MSSKLTVYFRVAILASESFPKTMLLLKTFSPDVVFTVTPVASPETSSWGLAAHTLAAVSAERPFVEACKIRWVSKSILKCYIMYRNILPKYIYKILFLWRKHAEYQHTGILQLILTSLRFKRMINNSIYVIR